MNHQSSSPSVGDSGGLRAVCWCTATAKAAHTPTPTPTPNQRQRHAATAPHALHLHQLKHLTSSTARRPPTPTTPALQHRTSNPAPFAEQTTKQPAKRTQTHRKVQRREAKSHLGSSESFALLVHVHARLGADGQTSQTGLGKVRWSILRSCLNEAGLGVRLPAATYATGWLVLSLPSVASRILAR